MTEFSSMLGSTDIGVRSVVGGVAVKRVVEYVPTKRDRRASTITKAGNLILVSVGRREAEAWEIGMS